MRLRAGFAALVLPMLLLSACGEETGTDSQSTSGSQSASETPSASASPSEAAPPDAPACTKVWKADAKLPAPYVGCYEGEDFIAPTQQMCGFGKPLVTYADGFYGVPGGTIHRTSKGLAADPSYAKDLAGCTA